MCKDGHAFILGSDAHIAFDLGNFKYAEELIAQLDIPEHLIVNRSVKFLKGISGT